MVARKLKNLCRFIAKMDFASIPRDVLDHAKLVLLDTLGVIIAGSKTAEANRIARNFPIIQSDKSGVTCPGRTETFHVLNAALINGIAGSTLEYEEGNSRARGHPAIQIVPAVVAESEASDLSGAKLLVGLVAGYETACRVSRASVIRRGLHPTGTWGVVGAALGVGYLGSKGVQGLFDIANIAASYAFSPYIKNSFVGRNVASTYAGLVNYLGLLSNVFFDSGIRADPAGFQMTFSQFISSGFNPDALDEKLGDSYAITENYFKPYPTCRFTHPALEALRAIIDRQAIDPQEVETVTVTSFKAAVHAENGLPSNIEAIRFSVPFLVSVMLLRGSINLGTLSEKLLQDPRIVELAAKVNLVYSKEYELMRPRNSPAKIEILLKDGQTISHEIIDCLGDPSNPIPPKDIHSKFLNLAEPILGPQKAQEFLSRIEEIESVNHIRPIMAIVKPVNKPNFEPICTGSKS